MRRALLFSLSIEARQVGTGGRLDARRLRQRHEEVLVTLARVATHNVAQRRIRFERRGIDRDRLAADQAGLAEALKHPSKHLPMRFEIDQPARPRNRRMIRRRLWKREPQKVAQRQRIRRPPRDGALRIDPFEVPDQQQPKVHPGREPRATHRGGVKPRTLRFGEVIGHAAAD